MSYITWRSKENSAELRGAERHYLGYISRGPSHIAWDIDYHLSLGLVENRIREIIDWFPLNHYYRSELQQNLNEPAALMRLASMLAGTLDYPITSDLYLTVNGYQLNAWHLNLNTALVAGSRPIQLAARLHAQCEIHGYVEGEHREWLASIIEEGLQAGIYRPDMGWDQVIALLKERHDGPVVTSYSVTGGFPNRQIADWAIPTDSLPSYFTKEQWGELTSEQQAGYHDDIFGELNEEHQWELAMAGLRYTRSSVRLDPQSMKRKFGPGLTVYDLFHPDRDERVRRAHM